MNKEIEEIRKLIFDLNHSLSYMSTENHVGKELYDKSSKLNELFSKLHPVGIDKSNYDNELKDTIKDLNEFHETYKKEFNFVINILIFSLRYALTKKIKI